MLPSCRFFIATACALLPNYSFAQTAGDLDSTFGTAGIVTTVISGSGNNAGVMVQPDGKIIAIGTSTSATGTNKMAVARYLSNGLLDPTFASGGIVETEIGLTATVGSASVLQPDGKIIVAGATIADRDRHEDYALLRYKRNGTIDSTFGINGIVIEDVNGVLDRVYAVLVQPDGKIIAAGTSNDGRTPYTYYLTMVRYLPNGTRDATFGIGGVVKQGTLATPSQVGFSAYLQADGKILAGGQLDTRFFLWRFKPDGQPDSSFAANGFLTNTTGQQHRTVHSIAVQPDGKILLSVKGFAFGRQVFAVLRYTSGGIPDATFGKAGEAISANGVFSEGYCMKLQPDGKILIAGMGYDKINAPDSKFYLTRFTKDGVPDVKFGKNGHVETDVDGTPLGSHGRSLAIQPDGNIVVSGTISSNDGFGLARYHGRSADDVDVEDTFTSVANHNMNGSMTIYPNPVHDIASLTYNLPAPATLSARLVNAAGITVKRYTVNRETAGKFDWLLDLKEIPAGSYILSVEVNGQYNSIPLIKQ